MIENDEFKKLVVKYLNICNIVALWYRIYYFFEIFGDKTTVSCWYMSNFPPSFVGIR